MNSTGPAAFLSYLAAGALVVLVMRMLGEMAVANPAIGSFVEYTRRAIGPWAGFTTGWLYWWFWAIVFAIEAVAGATIIHEWLPSVPVWTISLAVMALLTATNLVSVKSFGEFEFWFASIKVAAIVLFLAIAAGFLLGIGSGAPPGLSHLTDQGGFAPKGALTILSGVVIVVFAFVRAEIVTIAAAESEQPEKAVARATNQVVARVLTFYVLAVFLMLCVVPWNSTKLGASPFATALDTIGIPGAADIMNAIVVTAVLSCLNSGIYGGVPVKAILLSVSVGFVSVIFNAISPDKVFLFLVNASGAVALFVYLLICVAQLRMRRRLEAEAPERLKLKMWLFPYLTYATMAAMVAVIVSVGLVKDTRAQLIPSLISLAVVLGAAYVMGRRRREDPAPVADGAQPSGA